jgi:hypothetical protein
MLHREIIAVLSCNNVKYINAFCGKVKRFFFVLEEVVGICTNYCGLEDKDGR